jgi:hypothetical protein
MAKRPSFVAMLADIGFEDLSMTTNGTSLARRAERLKGCRPAAGERELRLAAARALRSDTAPR